MFSIGEEETIQQRVGELVLGLVNYLVSFISFDLKCKLLFSAKEKIKSNFIKLWASRAFL